MAVGRPSKFSEERATAIVEALREGRTRKAAYEGVRIDSETFARWLRRYADFAERVTHAEAEAEAKFTSILQKAAEGWEAGHRTITTRTVIRTKKTRKPDGTVIEEPVALQEVSETVHEERQFDWRAALEWLKRRRRDEWGDGIAVKFEKMTDDELLDYLRSGLPAVAPGAPDSSGDRLAAGTPPDRA